MTLHVAARDGDLEALRDRIARGGDVDGRNGLGCTPLMEACAGGHLECAQTLIEAGAAVDVVNNGGYTALMYACHLGHLECAQVLIDANAAVDMVNNHGWTALMEACHLGHLECAQVLIDAGAAVDTVNNYGETALLHACRRGHHECTRVLVDAQANLELTNTDGRNALMIACESPPFYFTQSQRQGRIKCALALLAATAPIQETDFSDRVASLKLACGRLQLIEVVLASTHVIEDAPPLGNVGVVKTDAQDIVASFARDMLARAPPRRRE
jgi:predicted LPLAT superfamily acyltransferase